MLFCVRFAIERLRQLTLVEKIKKLADEHNTTFAEIERKIDISNGQIRRWDNSSPKVENIQKVADYFDVSVDYLLGREEKTSLAEKYGAFAFDGEPISDEEMEFLLSVLDAKRKTEKK